MITYDASSRTVTLDPNANLAPGTIYTVTLSGTQDLWGNTMSPVSWSFTTAPGDTTAPTIAWQSPAPGPILVAVDSNVTVTFNEAVQASTISLVLTDANNHPVPAAITYDVASRTVTLDPSANLAPGSVYTVTLSGVEDLSGNLMHTVSWSFATTTANATSPSVIAQSPTPGATSALLNSTVTAVFSEDVQASTLSFVLTDPSNNVIPATISYDAATRLLTLVPSSPLAYLTTYTVTLSGVQDLSGDSLGTMSWSFTTVRDTTPPTVVTDTPAADATTVALDSVVTATFSKPVQQATISFVLTDSSDNTIPAMLTYDPTTQTATITPSSNLSYGTTYTATLSGTQDLSGNTMLPVAWSFTTIPAVVDATIWSSSATPSVPTASDGQAIEVGVKFESAVAGYITGIRFYKGSDNTGTHVGHLWDAQGDLLATATFTDESDSGWQQVNFSSPVAIQANTTYVASYYSPNGTFAIDGAYFATSETVNGELRALSSPESGGNGIFVEGTSGFPTVTVNSANYWVDVVFSNVLGTTSPTVVSTSPAAAATNVSLDSSVTATFSEAVLPGTISFVLTDPSDNTIPATLSYDPVSQTATLTPNSPLAYGTTYTATLSGAQDLAGNAMTTATWTFTTVPDTTPPTLVSTTPADGATDVALGTTITAVFDKALQQNTISFVLTDSSNNTISATLTYDPNSQTATLSPLSPLSYGTTYTATLRAQPTCSATPCCRWRGPSPPFQRSLMLPSGAVRPRLLFPPPPMARRLKSESSLNPL